MTQPKEPFFYSKDYPGFQKCTTDEEYMALYSGATEQHLAIGEASTSYLRSRVAVKEIEKTFDDPKYIVMLRQPIDLLATWHAHLVELLQEDVEDFGKAWRLSETRLRGEHVPRHCPDAAWLNYPDVANFADQVERLLSVVDRERVLFIKFDIFIADAEATYLQVLRFLGIENDSRDTFPKVNQRTKLRSRYLGYFQRRAGQLRRNLGFSDNHPIRRLTAPLTRKISKWNRQAGQRSAIPTLIQREIAELYLPQMNQLEHLTGLDLEDWKSRLLKATSMESLKSQ